MLHRIYILSKDGGRKAQKLLSVLSSFECVSVVDTAGIENSVYVPDEYLSGYEKVGFWISEKKYHALNRALYLAVRQSQEFEYAWFIEDDVALQESTFKQLVELCDKENATFYAWNILSKAASRDWFWWQEINVSFYRPARSLNMICCLRADLLDKVSTRLALGKKLCFHEVLFASLAHGYGLPCCDFNTHPEMRKLFGKFTWDQRVVRMAEGICHPVKDDEVHEKICSVF